MTSLLIIFSQNYPGDLLEITCFFPSRFPVYSLRLYIYMPVVLVLMRNTRIEKSLNKKMKLQYLGPLIVVSRNKEEAYILCKLDGSVLQNPIAQFCVLPYFDRKSIFLPEGFINIGADRLREMEEQDFVEGEEDLLDLPHENEFEDD